MKRWCFVIPVLALAIAMGAFLDAMLGQPIDWTTNTACGVAGILFGFAVLGLPPDPAR